MARVAQQNLQENILNSAYKLFCTLGYANTTLADIARDMGVSHGNIYRFFANKSAINNAICARMMQQIDVICDEIMQSSLNANDMLRKMLVAIHAYHSEHLISEQKLYDMVEVAMQENWQAIESHCDGMRQRFIKIIENGVEERTFQFDMRDCEEAGTAFYHMCACILHPMLVAQGLHKDPTQRDLVITYALKALSH